MTKGNKVKYLREDSLLIKRGDTGRITAILPANNQIRDAALKKGIKNPSDRMCMVRLETGAMFGWSLMNDWELTK